MTVRLHGVSALKGTASGRTVFIVGSGPSFAEFPGDALRGRLTVALNSAVELFEPTYWLYGCPKFARYTAKKIAPERPGGTALVMNQRHVPRVREKFPPEAEVDIYQFHNDADADRAEFLAGRWTIATTALSLAVLLGAARAVLVGIDMGSVDGAWYAPSVRFPPPRKQHIYVGQWRKWLQQGFRSGLWPLEVLTVSPYFAANCPGTPIRTITTEEACTF